MTPAHQVLSSLAMAVHHAILRLEANKPNKMSVHRLCTPVQPLFLLNYFCPP
jgi:hypothetical protein